MDLLSKSIDFYMVTTLAFNELKQAKTINSPIFSYTMNIYNKKLIK